MFNMTVEYQVLDGTANTVELTLATDDTATAIREANAVVSAGLLLNRESSSPAFVGGDLVFQAANPATPERGFEIIPPHRIVSVRLTPVPQQA